MSAHCPRCVRVVRFGRRGWMSRVLPRRLAPSCAVVRCVGRRGVSGWPWDAVLIGCVLCAPGAAASIRGNERSLLSARNNRCLLKAFLGSFAYLLFLPRLIEWGSCWGRSRNKGHFKPKKKKRGRDRERGGGNSKINIQVDSPDGLPRSLLGS